MVTDHLPDCPYASPCPQEWRNPQYAAESGPVIPHRIVSGSSGRCVECAAGDCICDELRVAENDGYLRGMAQSITTQAQQAIRNDAFDRARGAVDDDLDRYFAECDTKGVAAKDLIVVTYQRVFAVLDALKETP